MSQLRNISSQSLGMPPDLSLGSIASSSFSSPSRTNSPRPTSATTATTKSTVPSFTSISSASQPKRLAISTDETALTIRKLNNLSYGEEDEADVLGTPAKEKRWSLDDDPTTPHPGRVKSRQSVAASKSATNLTLRDQEKVNSQAFLRSYQHYLTPVLGITAYRPIKEGELQY